VSRFYLSLEDNLMRIFASDRVKNFMQALGMEKGEAIEHRMVTNAIEKAQRKVEGRNFDIRKQLLEYDDVANDQRQIIYQQRNDLLGEADIAETINTIRRDVVNEVIDGFIPPMSVEEQWDIPGLERQLEADFAIQLPLQQWLEEDDKLHEEAIRERIVESIQSAYDAKCAPSGRTCGVSRSRSCCRCWTRCGRSTWRPWTICARVFTCAPMHRRTPSRSTSARPSSCSRAC
jgi:preprotein translocase subunit SecA